MDIDELTPEKQLHEAYLALGFVAGERRERAFADLARRALLDVTTDLTGPPENTQHWRLPLNRAHHKIDTILNAAADAFVFAFGPTLWPDDPNARHHLADCWIYFRNEIRTWDVDEHGVEPVVMASNIGQLMRRYMVCLSCMPAGRPENPDLQAFLFDVVTDNDHGYAEQASAAMGLLRLGDEDDGSLAQTMNEPSTLDDDSAAMTSSMLARMSIDENGTRDMNDGKDI